MKKEVTRVSTGYKLLAGVTMLICNSGRKNLKN